MWKIVVLVLLLYSCGPQTLEDYRREGRQSVRSLAKELSCIQTRQDLITAGPKIKKKFDELVDLMIASREFYERYPSEEMIPLGEEDREASDELRQEIERIGRIQGAEALLAKYQEEALDRLHLFELQIEDRKIRKKVISSW
jgi:ABC-type enterochelin transport system substrate-binding protein